MEPHTNYTKFKERILNKLSCLAALPLSALYLAAAEVFVDCVLELNTDLLLESFHAQVGNAVPITRINMAMGFVYAMIFSFVIDINWAAVTLIIMAIFTGVLTEYSKKGTASTGRLIAAFALSWIRSAVQPLRLAFMAEQIPRTMKRSHRRGYFSFIVACWLLSKSGHWIYFYLKESRKAVRIAYMVCICVTLLYSALIIYIEFSTRYERKYFKALDRINKVCHDKGQKKWDMYHIAITLTAQTFAMLITSEVRDKQYIALTYEYELLTEDVSLYGAFPGILGILVLIFALTIVEPVLNRYGVKTTDLRYIGAGMIFGCISLGFTALMQRSLDATLRPPNRNEGLLFIFNTLPTTTSLISKLFDKNQRTWLQVPNQSETIFYADNIVGKREYPVSISNTAEEIWDEDFIRLEDGKLSAYVIANKKLFQMTGLDIYQDEIINKGKVLVGCTLDICVGNVYFHQGNNVEVVPLTGDSAFTTHHLKGGSYNVTTFIMNEREYTIRSNFTIKNSDTVAGLVVDKEGDVDLLSYNIQHPKSISLYHLVLQDIFVALSDSLFAVGLLNFLYTETNESCPSRQFTYSAFYLIFAGMPWMVFGGVRINSFTFGAFLINVFLLYYGCCTVLFVYTAYRYEHRWVKVDSPE